MTTWPDCVNGAFELSGAYFVGLSVRAARPAGAQVVTHGVFELRKYL